MACPAAQPCGEHPVLIPDSRFIERPHVLILRPPHCCFLLLLAVESFWTVVGAGWFLNVPGVCFMDLLLGTLHDGVTDRLYASYCRRTIALP